MKREPFTKRKKRERESHAPAPVKPPTELDDFQKDVERQVKQADNEPDQRRADMMRGGPFFW